MFFCLLSLFEALCQMALSFQAFLHREEAIHRVQTQTLILTLTLTRASCDVSRCSVARKLQKEEGRPGCKGLKRPWENLYIESL